MNADRKYNLCSWYVPNSNLVLLSLPRTGSTAVRIAIERQHLGIDLEKTDSYQFAAELRLESDIKLPDIIAKGYRIVATVKNPVDRMISYYRKFIYLNDYEEQMIPVFWNPSIFYSKMSFPVFVKHLCATHNAKLDQHYAPQTFLISVALNAEPEEWLPHVTLVRAENLEAELLPILNAQGVNISKIPREFVTPICPANVDFNPEMVRMVNRKFADDFRVLGYSPLPEGGDA